MFHFFHFDSDPRPPPPPFFLYVGERTGLVVRASDSGSGDPGSILSRIGVLFP